MIKRFLWESGAVWMLCLLASCSNSLENNLAGKWQLHKVETAEGTTVVDTVFYNFQGKDVFMIQILTSKDKVRGHLYGFWESPAEKTLSIEVLSYGYNVEDVLPYTDWKDKKRIFDINCIKRSEMILSGDDKCYYFKKF